MWNSAALFWWVMDEELGLVHLSLLKLVFPASNFMSNKLLLICIPSAGQQMLGHLANVEMRWPGTFSFLFLGCILITELPKKDTTVAITSSTYWWTIQGE